MQEYYVHYTDPVKPSTLQSTVRHAVCPQNGRLLGGIKRSHESALVDQRFLRCFEVRDLILTGKAYDMSTKGNLQVEMDVYIVTNHTASSEQQRTLDQGNNDNLKKSVQCICQHTCSCFSTGFAQLAEQPLICLMVRLVAVGQWLSSSFDRATESRSHVRC